MITVFGRRIECGDRADLRRTATGIRPGQSAFFCNVHMLNLSRSHPALAQAMDAAEFVFPDGAPVAWLQRRLGRSQAAVLRGYEAMELVCKQAAFSGKSVGFLGTTEDVLSSLASYLAQRCPGLLVVYSYAPPMLPENAPLDPVLAGQINAAAPDYLFVSLGCPKQEIWIHNYSNHLNCAMLGVGAAFGWLSGSKPMPPRCMERFGLAWLFRLVTEPRHTAKRYFVHNAQFIFAAARLLLFKSARFTTESDK